MADKADFVGTSDFQKRSDAVEWTFYLFESEGGDRLEVDHRGFDVGMPQETLDSLEVITGQEQMTCEGVAEGMWGNSFEDARAGSGLFDSALDVGFVEVVAA